MSDVELREIVEQISLSEMFLVGMSDEPTVEVISWAIDVGIQTRLADRFDFLSRGVYGLFLEASRVVRGTREWGSIRDH